MSQRNPMNDRYQSERQGQTRKSAAAAKPKSRAAASVYVKPAGKSPQEKKAAQKAERARQADLDRKYYNPPTEEYKRLRRLWWILLIAAIGLTVLAMFVAPSLAETIPWITWAFLIPAYGCIIGALYLDFSKIRRVRRAYQLEMARKHPKEAKRHAATNAANKHAEQKEAQRAEKPGLLGRLFGKKKAGGPSADEKAGARKASEAAKGGKGAKASKGADAEVADSAKPIAQLKAEREAAKKAADEGSEGDTAADGK